MLGGGMPPPNCSPFVGCVPGTGKDATLGLFFPYGKEKKQFQAIKKVS